MNIPFIFVISFSCLSHLSGLQVIDASGRVFGHGMLGYTVSPNPNSDLPCWDSPPPKLPFSFSTYPNRLAQCEETRIYWKADEVQGNPNFFSFIVGDEFFPIDPVNDIIEDIPGYGRGFIWRPPIRMGLAVVIVAGDFRGKATGGGMVMKVGSGTLFTNSTGDPWVGICPPQNGTGITYPVRDGPSRTSSFFNTGTAIGTALGAVSVLLALAILLFVKRRRRRRQNGTTPVITTPTITESKRDKREREQGLPGDPDRRPAFYLPEPMSSPSPVTQVQLESGIGPAGWPSYYHLEPLQGLDTPSTGKGEVPTQPPTHSGIYTEMRTDVN